MLRILLVVLTLTVLVGCRTAPKPGDETLGPMGATFNPGDLDSAIINPGDVYDDTIATDMAMPVAGGATFMNANDPRLASINPQLAADAQAVLHDIHFAYNSSEILPNEARILEQIGVFMNRFPEALLEIEGHCDDRGTEEYNMALGSRRAAAVRQFLSDLNVNYNRLYTISFGEESPADPSQGESAWAKNRRAHFNVGVTGR
jgi:outer membrane protein OmpA-like peptidoglycan-associated protein